MDGDELPRLGHGYNDPHAIMPEIRETGDPLPPWADDPTDLVNYIESAWPVNDTDLERLEEEAARMDWNHCSYCGTEYREEHWEEDRTVQYREDKDVKHEVTYAVWCDDHAQDGEHFSYTMEWFE